MNRDCFPFSYLSLYDFYDFTKNLNVIITPETQITKLYILMYIIRFSNI